jgi:hypothetical protein
VTAWKYCSLKFSSFSFLLDMHDIAIVRKNLQEALWLVVDNCVFGAQLWWTCCKSLFRLLICIFFHKEYYLLRHYTRWLKEEFLAYQVCWAQLFRL